MRFTANQAARMRLADDVWVEVRDELARAVRKFPAFNSGHEGYAVILEEMDELFEEVRANNPAKAHAEAVQVAAMAIRFLTDLKP